MVRDVHERENLLRDAKAFISRVELRLYPADQPQELFSGFRAGGALSLYFGQDPVYQFNTRKELRRAFDSDRILKAEEGRLVAWSPRRTETSTEMLRHELDDAQQEQFCQAMTERMRSLQDAIGSKKYVLLGQVPEQEDVVARLCEWLDGWSELIVADSPKVG